MFRTALGETTFQNKYAHAGCETWPRLCRILVEDVCGPGVNTKIKEALMSQEDIEALIHHMTDFKFMPGGRYLYYAGRRNKFYNNCYLLRAEVDSRQDWASLMERSVSCLMSGGGIGTDYSNYRASDMKITGTGGLASGPIPAMYMTNECGRNVMQGGSRRSAIYASLKWSHGDVFKFLKSKNWADMKIPGTDVTFAQAKENDFNAHAPLDMTNISVNYNTDWLMHYLQTGEVGDVFKENVQQALSTGEPGFSFNFFEKENETLRNACTEVSSEDDSDVCNLGSINLANIDSITELKEVVELATKFLLCGTLRADLPYQKVEEVRAKNRRLGLGLMGVHEWLLMRGSNYEVTEELHDWLNVYKRQSDSTSKSFSYELGVSQPVAVRAIAPTGTIGIVAGTTTGIEPIYAVAYKRRYLKDGTNWHWQYCIDQSAKSIIEEYGTDPATIETANELARDYERRIKFQAQVQDYVDMAISSTINLPPWGSKHNNEDTVERFTSILAGYAQRIRGFTCYPDAGRGGQPITEVPYLEALNQEGVEFKEHDICDITNHGGTCGA